MNAKSVLDKIVQLLSAAETAAEETKVQMAYGKLSDGTILTSPSFAIDEALEIVAEDGTKTPAPDGEHEVVIEVEGGTKSLSVETKGGKIVAVEEKEVEAAVTDPGAELPKEAVVEAGQETPPQITLEELAARLVKCEEMLAKMSEYTKPKEEEKKEDVKEEMEAELPVQKLDGAPVEETRFFGFESKKTNKINNAHMRVLEKLYK